MCREKVNMFPGFLRMEAYTCCEWKSRSGFKLIRAHTAARSSVDNVMSDVGHEGG